VIGGDRMTPDYQALPLTRRQLHTWLSPETGHSGTECVLSLFARIDGTVESDALEHGIRLGLQEAESRRATFFDAYGQNFQRATNGPGVEHRTLRRPIGIRVMTSSNTQHSDRATNKSKARWLDQPVPTSKSNVLTEPADEKRMSGSG
jgi:hypothetical protein